VVNIVPSVNSKPWKENLKERDKPEDLGEECIIPLKWILRNKKTAWTGFAGLRLGTSEIFL